MGGNRVMFSPRPTPRTTVTQLPITPVHASRRNQGAHASRKQATRYDDECEKDGSVTPTTTASECSSPATVYDYDPTLRYEEPVNLMCPIARPFGDEPALQPGDRRRVTKPLGQPRFHPPVPGAWWDRTTKMATVECND